MLALWTGTQPNLALVRCLVPLCQWWLSCPQVLHFVYCVSIWCDRSHPVWAMKPASADNSEPCHCCRCEAPGLCPFSQCQELLEALPTLPVATCQLCHPPCLARSQSLCPPSLRKLLSFQATSKGGGHLPSDHRFLLPLPDVTIGTQLLFSPFSISVGSSRQLQDIPCPAVWQKVSTALVQPCLVFSVWVQSTSLTFKM